MSAGSLVHRPFGIGVIEVSTEYIEEVVVPKEVSQVLACRAFPAVAEKSQAENRRLSNSFLRRFSFSSLDWHRSLFRPSGVHAGLSKRRIPRVFEPELGEGLKETDRCHIRKRQNIRVLSDLRGTCWNSRRKTYLSAGPCTEDAVRLTPASVFTADGCSRLLPV